MHKVELNTNMDKNLNWGKQYSFAEFQYMRAFVRFCIADIPEAIACI